MLSPTTTRPVDLMDGMDIVQALPRRSRPGVAFQRTVAVGGRTLAVHGVRSPAPDLTRERFDEAVARRAEASGHRLLPVVATGHVADCHWVAYEVGTAVSLAAEAPRRWPVGTCVDLISDLALVLAQAASEGLLPWELGPESIFLDPKFGALVTDLGTAREALGEMSVDREDSAGFVPPEVRRGAGAGERSGVFLCGALMHELLAGRPGLAAEIDLVLARATATDSLERYRTAGELCRSARRALLEEIAGTETSPAAPAANPPADPLIYGWAPPPSRFSQVLAATGVLLSLAAGAAWGVASRGEGAETPPRVERATGQGMVVTLPPGWIAGPRNASDLSANPAIDGFSGLRVSLHEGAAGVARDDPVRLGRIEVWRDRSDAPSAVRYVAPTASGSLVITCEASPGALPGTLRECEHAASTIDPGPVRVLPLRGVTDDPGMWATLERLTSDLAAGRRGLAHATTPSAQRRAARALARAHDRGAARLLRVPEAKAIATAARRASRAYGALARAAGGRSSTRWNAARRAVRRSDAALSEAIAEQAL